MVAAHEASPVISSSTSDARSCSRGLFDLLYKYLRGVIVDVVKRGKPPLALKAAAISGWWASSTLTIAVACTRRSTPAVIERAESHALVRTRRQPS